MKVLSSCLSLFHTSLPITTTSLTSYHTALILQPWLSFSHRTLSASFHPCTSVRLLYHCLLSHPTHPAVCYHCCLLPSFLPRTLTRLASCTCVVPFLLLFHLLTMATAEEETMAEEQEAVGYEDIQQLQELGVNAQDVKRLKEAGQRTQPARDATAA